MSKKIVPFGKYKGRSVEELEADRPYAEWLSGQDWFKQRFAELYALLALNQTASETPEHNAMQARFLDPAYGARMVDLVGQLPNRIAFGCERYVQFEDHGADVAIYDGKPDDHRSINDRSWASGSSYRIELKPSLGDDYPAALRQMLASRCNVLVVGQYAGVGATWDQVVEIFKSSGIKALLAASIDVAPHT